MNTGQCRECMLRREVWPIMRRGGGTYRRGGRRYRSSICGPCAVYLTENGWSSRFDTMELTRIAEQHQRTTS